MGVETSFVLEPIPDLAWYDLAPERFVLESELECGPERLFSIFEDPVAWTIWVRDILRVEWTSPRPYGEGTTRTVVARGGLVVDEVFLAWEPGTRMAFTFVTATKNVWRRMGERYEVEDLGGDRCRLRWTVAYEPRGFFAALHPMIRPLMRRALARSLANLGDYVAAGGGRHEVSRVSKTALWTASARARDAASARPVCGDAFAARFTDAADDPLVKDFLALRRPTESIAVRHAFIDEVVRRRLATRPDGLVVILGAGLDTRAYRLGVGRFVEVDQPALLAWKEERLPIAECPRPLERIAIDFDRETLEGRLRHLATEEPVLVIAEGLLPYLEPASVESIFVTLSELFPSHVIVADVLSARFLERFGGELLPVLARHGLGLPTRPTSPRGLFEDAGYREVEVVATLEQMMRPTRFVRWLLRDLFEGSVVCIATRA